MANVAQLVEPRFVVPVVVGSSPIVRPRLKKGVFNLGAFFFMRNHGSNSVSLALASRLEPELAGEEGSTDLKLENIDKCG